MNRSSRLIPCDDATQATTQWITMNSKNTSAICVMMYHVLIGFSRGLTNDYSDMRSSIWSSAMPHPFRKIGPRRRCSRIASLPRRSYHIFTGWWFEPYPSEKSWSSSMGRITCHKLIYINIYMENKSHVPNHQAVHIFCWMSWWWVMMSWCNFLWTTGLWRRTTRVF